MLRAACYRSVGIGCKSNISTCWQQRSIFVGKGSGGSGGSSSSRGRIGDGATLFADKIGVAGGAAAIIVGGAIAARLVYGHLLVSPNESNHGPRRDASKVSVLLNTAAIERNKIAKITPERLATGKAPGGSDVYTPDGQLQVVDAAEFAAFVTEQRNMFNAAKQRSQKASEDILKKELKEALSDVSDRVSGFADWYFAYPTTYKLLGIAMTSAAKHAVTFRTEKSLSAEVSEELQAHVCRKYEALVLRPALTDPKVHRAFVRSLRAAHEGYLEAVRELDESVAAFVSKQAGPYSSAPRHDEVVVDMDWSAQLQKVEHVPLAYEKSPEITVALIGAGAAAGKVAGGAVMGGAAKAIAAKLAAPFATKAVGATLGGGATAGAVGGAIAAGPAGAAVGAAAGAAIGLGVDMGVNAGVALMQRSTFEKDVRGSLEATRFEWEERLLLELERVQGVWFGHAEALLNISSANSREDDDEATTNR